MDYKSYFLSLRFFLNLQGFNWHMLLLPVLNMRNMQQIQKLIKGKIQLKVWGKREWEDMMMFGWGMLKYQIRAISWNFQ